MEKTIDMMTVMDTKRRIISISVLFLIILSITLSFSKEAIAPTGPVEEGIPTEEFAKLTAAEKKELLSAALYSNDYDTIKRFIEAGAEPKGEDEEGWTMLMILASTEKSDERIVDLLIAGGAETGKKSDDGTTALLESLMHDKVNMALVRKLVEAGEDLEAGNNEGATPLMIATKRGHAEVVRYLLDKGAIKDEKDAYKKSAYDYAKEGGYDDIARLLEGEESH